MRTWKIGVLGALCGTAAGQPVDDPARLDLAPEPDARSAWELRRVTAYWENDGAFIKPLGDTDRHYTNGFKLDVAFDPHFSRETVERIAPPSSWTDPRIAVGFVVSQHIYTGRDIQLAQAPPDERPWAGYLYFGAYLQRATDRVHDHFELDVGFVGRETGAEFVQETVHQAFPGQDTPQGWDRQLSHEFTINVRVQRSWRTERAEIGRFELDAVPRLGFDLGNVFVRANADMLFRFGVHLPDDFGPGRIMDYADATGGWSAEHDWGVYAYARPGIRAVAHNLFLDGNTFADSPSVDSLPFVAELTLGLAGRWGSWEAGYSITLMTHEFENQGSSDSHASIFIAWSKPF